MHFVRTLPPLPGGHWLVRQDPVWIGAIALAVLYTSHYLGSPLLPGRPDLGPSGWLTWYDQGKYLRSATALARFDLRPDEHHYLPAYALLGAMFVNSSPFHPFFFVDLGSLLISFAAFVRFARSCGLGRVTGAVLFVLAAAGDPILFDQWVVPWTTSPLAAALWSLLAISAAHIEGNRHPFLLGLMSVCLPMLRPTDLLLAVPALLFCLVFDIRGRRLRFRDFGSFAFGFLVPAGLYLLLYLLIYGPRLSEYLRLSADIGFTLHGIGWKAYVVLIDPRAWIGGGEGLLRRAPWLILGIAGLVPALRRPAPAMLAVTLVLHSTIYLAYVDLLPTGFWRFWNVHYWIWTFPGCALLGLLLLRDLLRSGHRLVAAASLAVTILLLCLRIDPKAAATEESVDALDFPAHALPFEQVYFGPLTIRDSVGTLNNVQKFRAIPMQQGIRVLALTRPFQGEISAAGDGLEGTPPTRIHAVLRFGVPDWEEEEAGGSYGP